SHWLYADGTHHGKTINRELTALFLRCARLARMLVKPHLVFDSDKRPPIKRNKTV
ncbi:hypothetical protein PILCRDRAFT_26449, partial [Piloderma croceum F 1598]